MHRHCEPVRSIMATSAMIIRLCEHHSYAVQEWHHRAARECNHTCVLHLHEPWSHYWIRMGYSQPVGSTRTSTAQLVTMSSPCDSRVQTHRWWLTYSVERGAEVMNQDPKGSPWGQLSAMGLGWPAVCLGDTRHCGVYSKISNIDLVEL
jgi:hypothetical protein